MNGAGARSAEAAGTPAASTRTRARTGPCDVVSAQNPSGDQRARRTSHPSRTWPATSRARSRLATLGRGVPLLPGEQEGDDGGGFRWRQRVAPAGDTLLAGPGAARPVLLDVSVAVSWRLDGRAREVVLRTQRLALLPPEPP